MAIAIKDIPTLKGKNARRFAEKADDVLKNKKGSIDFSKQIEITKKILANAKL